MAQKKSGYLLYDLPDGLLKTLKQRALNEDTTLKQIIIKALEKAAKIKTN